MQAFSQVHFRIKFCYLLFISLIPLIKALDGFLMVLSNEGKVLYVSETVSVHLGLSQVSVELKENLHLFRCFNLQDKKLLLPYDKCNPFDTHNTSILCPLDLTPGPK